MPAIHLDIAADHPAFTGHFPHQPIVPGVVLLDHAQRAIEASTGSILVGLAVAKFHSPAVPGEVLTVEFEASAESVRFEIRTASRKVADGRFQIQTETLV
jgi:3-hydroxymyristoyl/3-hydroxydecanoyl-(acyl carrier protein) dehydratase